MAKKKMTSKERVLTTFAHQEADRVPIGYGANGGIDGRLRKYYKEVRGDDRDLAEILGTDFRGAGGRYTGESLHENSPDPKLNIDGLWGIHTRLIEHDSGSYWDYCDFPLKEADEEMIANWPMPNPDDFDYSGVAEQCEINKEFAVNGSGGFGDIINGNGMLRTMQQTLIDLITDDPAGLLLAKRRVDIQVEITRRILEAAKGGVDYIHIGEDLGTQIAPIISMDIFRKHIRPAYQKFCDLAKAYGVYVMIHTCGSSSWAYEDFIEMGIHGVDTLQPEAKDMSPRYLKDHFGGRLFFHGCISTAGPVAYGTVQDVIDNCRETLDIMMPGGGYCFAPTHALQDNSPTENVVAMYDVAHEYGRY